MNAAVIKKTSDQDKNCAITNESPPGTRLDALDAVINKEVPNPNSLSVKISRLYASITISCVADAKDKMTETTAITERLVLGENLPNKKIEKKTAIWEINIQLRRLPK